MDVDFLRSTYAYSNSIGPVISQVVVLSHPLIHPGSIVLCAHY